MNRTSGIKLALFGATGLVGRTMLTVLEERGVVVTELIPVASPRSRRALLSFSGRDYSVSTPDDGRWEKADAALLSAGSQISREWIPQLVDSGLICIDNSSAFRLDERIPLVIPEVNADVIRPEDRLIANPNCSAIQLIMILAPLHRAFDLRKVVVATYQSASGAGQKGKVRLQNEMHGDFAGSTPFPHPLFENVIPGIGELTESDYYVEEWKLVMETRKILRLPNLQVFPTAVRVPTLHCHAEAVHLEFTDSVDPAEAREVLQDSPGVIVRDHPNENGYPLPRECAGKDEVFVGRIRQIPGERHTLDLWIVADNLRKGAATNAVQILEHILVKDLLSR